MSDDEHLLRYWLWRTHAHHHYLYGDDGEFQCNTCGLDFKRDSVKKIDEKLQQNHTDWLVENADEINKRMDRAVLKATRNVKRTFK